MPRLLLLPGTRLLGSLHRLLVSTLVPATALITPASLVAPTTLISAAALVASSSAAIGMGSVEAVSEPVHHLRIDPFRGELRLQIRHDFIGNAVLPDHRHGELLS